MDTRSPEALIAEVRAALGVAVAVATSAAPTEDQLKALREQAAAGNDALNEIAARLLDEKAAGIAGGTPPDPGITG